MGESVGRWGANCATHERTEGLVVRAQPERRGLQEFSRQLYTAGWEEKKQHSHSRFLRNSCRKGKNESAEGLTEERGKTERRTACQGKKKKKARKATDVRRLGVAPNKKRKKKKKKKKKRGVLGSSKRGRGRKIRSKKVEERRCIGERLPQGRGHNESGL